MISKRDVQLGKIALQEDMVSKEQINKCLKIKKKLKTKASLGAILLKKGYIDRDQLEIIVGIHNNKSDGKDDDDQKKSKRKTSRKDKEKDSEKGEAKDAKKDSERAERRKKRATAKRKREKLEEDGEAKEKSGDSVEAEGDDKKEDKETRRSKRSKSADTKRKRRSKRLTEQKEEKDGDDKEKEKDDSAETTEADEKKKKRRSERKKRRSKREDKVSEPDIGEAVNRDAEESKAPSDDDKGGDPEKSDEDEELLDPSVLVSAGNDVPDEQADLMANLLASTLEGPEDDEHHSFESGASLISDSLLESADMTLSQEEDVVDDAGKIQKKIIACSDCGKKYRVKPKQAGKRFDCRRCKTKVRVPKDYFGTEDEDIVEVPRKKKKRDKKDRKKGRTGRHSRRSKRSKTKESKSSASIPVEEFDLGAMESDEEFEAQSKAKKESKRKSQRAEKKDDKKGTATSYADLAEQALKAPKASVAARTMTKGSVVQLITFSIILVLAIGGIVGYLQYEEGIRLAAIEKNKKAELDKITTSLKDISDQADALLEKQAVTANDADLFRSMEREVQSADAIRDTLLFPENRAKAEDLSRNTYKLLEKRQLLLSKAAEIFVGMNTLSMQQEAVTIYEKTLKIKKNPDVLAAYARSQARLYQWNEALQSVQQALDIDKGNKKALLIKGYILESADAPNEAADVYELLARSNPFAGVLCARSWMNAGDKASAVKKLAEAASAEAVQSDPVKLATVQIFEAELSQRKEDFSSAEVNLKKALKTAPKYPWPSIKLGYLYLKMGQFDQALAQFEAAQSNGGGPEAYLGLAMTYEANFDTDKAKEFYRKAAGAKSTKESLGPKIDDVYVLNDPLNPQNVRSRAKRRLGDLFRALGDLERAEREYQEARKADEWNGIALTRLARIYKKTEFDQKALSMLRTAAALTTGYKQGNPITFEGKARRRSVATFEYFVTLGLFEQKDQKYGRAGNAYDIAVKIGEGLNVKSTEVYTLQARLLLNKNKNKEAIRAFRSLERKEAQNKIYLQGLNAYKNFESTKNVAELDKVEAAASAVLSQNENHSAAYMLRANAYAGRAAAILKKIGKPDPKEHAEQLKEISQLEKKARGSFSEAITVNPYSVKARMARGEFLTNSIGQNDFQTAFEDFKVVTKLPSPSIDALYGYALCAYNLNNFADAHAAVSKAIRKNFNFKKGYALRAKINDRLNRPKDAEKDRRKAK